MNKAMKNFISLLLAALLLCGCGKVDQQDDSDLNGKKIVFVGDSFLFTGRCVMPIKDCSEGSRQNDVGYFYQLCKANGIGVSVTNWTFGGKCLDEIMDRYICDYTDLSYDYVILSGGRKSTATYAELEKTLDRYVETFRAANPNVQFLYLVTSGAHNLSVKETFPVDVLNNLEKVEQKGITVVDWGGLVADLAFGNVEVPGGMQTYNNYTFVHNRAETDGFHPNQLTGYITAQMIYCAITGESAVGQPYDFWNKDPFDPQAYYEYAYPCGPSNYQEVFDSDADMTGIQELIDRYLEEKPYLNYNF